MTDHWEEIQNRLETVCSALEKDFRPNPEKKSEILKDRAKALAKRAGKREEDEACLQVVEFLLAHEKYCIELVHIREVYPLKDLTPLPCTPPCVLGIINFRGQILSIVDLKKFFDLPEQELTDHHVIILSSDEMEFGILADAILGVRHIPLSEIQPTLSTFTGIGAEYLRGVTKDRAVVLDGGKILSDKNIVVHQETGGS
ncbi:chemotaxis protein CheW [Desulfobacterales bacterium HSG2]|nr:chemotaxis protein CheW [Desulfobacterales bacterium HSG2]